MFETILLSTDPLRGRSVRQILMDTGQVTLSRHLESHPSTYELVRLLNVTQPNLFVVDLDDGDCVGETIRHVRERSKSTAIIAFGDEIGGDSRLAESIGVEAVVPYVPDVPTMQAAIDRAMHQTQGELIDNLYAFLPGKAGSGTSSIVLNTAVRLATDFGKRTLVLEADLRSGALSILLGIDHQGGSQRVLEVAGNVDTFQWENNIVRKHGVEFLLTQRETTGAIPGWHNYHLLLNFARRKYDMILVDLPELVNPATVEIVRRAAATFVITTPEIAPLRMAKQRCAEITLWGAPPTRVHMVLNRWQKGEMDPGEVSKFTGHDVAAVLPNDYRSLRAAEQEGAGITSATKLGRALQEFAGQLVGVEVNKSPGLLNRLFG